MVIFYQYNSLILFKTVDTHTWPWQGEDVTAESPSSSREWHPSKDATTFQEECLHPSLLFIHLLELSKDGLLVLVSMTRPNISWRFQTSRPCQILNGVLTKASYEMCCDLPAGRFSVVSRGKANDLRALGTASHGIFAGCWLWQTLSTFGNRSQESVAYPSSK